MHHGMMLASHLLHSCDAVWPPLTPAKSHFWMSPPLPQHKSSRLCLPLANLQQEQ